MDTVTTCRAATAQDMAAVVEIWAEAFGDAPAEIPQHLHRFVGEDNLYVAEGKDGVDAILSAVPCRTGDISGAYFYALATRSIRRGRGLMAQLMAYAEAQCLARGMRYICLIPSSASLFGYYASFGYTKLYLRRVELPLQAAFGPAPVRLGAAEYAARRDALLLEPAIRFDAGRSTQLVQEALDIGFTTAGVPEAACVYGLQKGKLLVAELAAGSPQAGLGLLGAAAQAAQAQSIALTLPVHSPLFAGQGSLVPTGQIKPLGAAAVPEGVYLRFGMDALFNKDYEQP